MDRPARTATAIRALVVSVYQQNIPPEVVSAQAEVVTRWLPRGCEFEQRQVSHHALGLDECLKGGPQRDVYLVLDIDCIPLESWAMAWMLHTADAGVLVGCAQRANHLANGNHIYAGPCGLTFSRETYERIGRPSFQATERGDVAEEITHACQALGVPLSLLWPTHVEAPKWTLLPNVEFGLGTTYGGIFYHAFEISKGATTDAFLAKCRDALAKETSLR